MLTRSKPTDPLAGASRAGKAVFAKLKSELTTRRELQVDALSSAIGALAGHACQVAALEGLRAGLPEYAGMSLVVLTTVDGTELYSGDAINRPLAERPNSVWELVAGSAAKFGVTGIDPAEYFQHVASTVGHADFGIPRQLPPGSPLPSSFLPNWEPMLRIIRKSAPDPQAWPLAYGFAAQHLFAAANGKVDLALPLGVILEGAIAMSKVKPPS